MIAIDTNVLLRYLLVDDTIQANKAKKLITGSDKVLITDVVLTETLWTLKGKRYNLKKDDLVLVVNALFKEPNIIFENGQVIWRALTDFINASSVRSGGKRKEADFPDSLIINKARFIANSNKVKFSGCYTFDVAVQQIPGAIKP